MVIAKLPMSHPVSNQLSIAGRCLCSWQDSKYQPSSNPSTKKSWPIKPVPNVSTMGISATMKETDDKGLSCENTKQEAALKDMRLKKRGYQRSEGS